MKRLLSTLCAMAIAVSVYTTGTSPASASDADAAGEATYDISYAGILDMYIHALNAGGEDTGTQELFNSQTVEASKETGAKRFQETKNRVGYCIADLNGDGTDELIIGEHSALIYEVFTTDGGRARELIRTDRESRCALLSGGAFWQYTRDGEAAAESTVWKMDGTGETAFAEGYRMENTFSPDGYIHAYQWFRMAEDGSMAVSRETLVSTDEYQEWLKAQDARLLPLVFIPLAMYEQESDPEKTGIISVGGKTSGKDEVRVRSAARKNSRIVREVRIGTYAAILGEEDNYYKIRFGTTEGYIQKDFFTKISEAPASLKAGIYDAQSEEAMKKAEETALNPFEGFALVMDGNREVEVPKAGAAETEEAPADGREEQAGEAPEGEAGTEAETEKITVPVYRMIPKDKTE